MTIETSTMHLDDIIDIRDIIERIEELEDSEDGVVMAPHDVEYRTLYALMENLKGDGGDERWRGDWYPVTLIRESYFVDYAQELAEETGAVNPQAHWPNNCIDWDQAARELAHDYTPVEIEGVTYFYR
jgi:hypothetical protein